MKRSLLLFVAIISCSIVYSQFSTTENEYDFGVIGEKDGTVSTVFQITNTDALPLTISSVKSSCGCTVAEYSSAPIQPNEQGNITVTYNPLGRPGNFQKSVTATMQSNGQTYTTTFTIKGKVTPQSVASSKTSGDYATLYMWLKKVPFPTPVMLFVEINGEFAGAFTSGEYAIFKLNKGVHDINVYSNFNRFGAFMPACTYEMAKPNGAHIAYRSIDMTTMSTYYIDTSKKTLSNQDSFHKTLEKKKIAAAREEAFDLTKPKEKSTPDEKRVPIEETPRDKGFAQSQEKKNSTSSLDLNIPTTTAKNTNMYVLIISNEKI